MHATTAWPKVQTFKRSYATPPLDPMRSSENPKQAGLVVERMRHHITKKVAHPRNPKLSQLCAKQLLLLASCVKFVIVLRDEVPWVERSSLPSHLASLLTLVSPNWSYYYGTVRDSSPIRNARSNPCHCTRHQQATAVVRSRQIPPAGVLLWRVLCTSSLSQLDIG